MLTYGQIKALDALLFEEFHNSETVVENGGYLYGTGGAGPPTVQGYASFSNSNNQVIRYPRQKLRPAGHALTMIIDFRIRENLVTNLAACGFDTSANYKAMIWIPTVATSIWAFTRHASGIANTSYNIGSSIVGTRLFVTLTFDSKIGANRLKLYVNDTLANQTAAHAEPIVQPTVGFELCRYLGASGSFDIYSVLVSKRAWTQQEISDWINNRTFTYDKDAVLYLPMHDKVGSAAPYITSDVSDYGRDATLGDGAVVATFPDKIVDRNGYIYDGSKYLTVGDDSDFDLGTDAEKSIELSYYKGNTNLENLFRKNDGALANDSGYEITADTNVVVNVNDGNAAVLALTSAKDVIKNDNHIVAVFDRPNDELILYLNGDDGEIFDISGRPGSYANSEDLLLFLSLVGNGYKVGFFNKRLTRTQAKDLYNKFNLWKVGRYQM